MPPPDHPRGWRLEQGAEAAGERGSTELLFLS